MYGIHWISRKWKDYCHSLYDLWLFERLTLAMIKQLPKGYKVCLLKNEFGDVKGQKNSRIELIIVDSELAKESNIDGVQEMLNGCLCCTLVRLQKNPTYKRSEEWQTHYSN
jgi:hypothetical protein